MLTFIKKKKSSLKKVKYATFFLFFFLYLTIFACSDAGNIEPSNFCNHACSYWEYCDYNTQQCKINLESGFCQEDTHCNAYNYCNIETHRCTPKIHNCDEGCYAWETCENSVCVLKEGHCYWDNDCLESQTCKQETKTCEYPSNKCFLDCESWEVCEINVDTSERTCIPKENLAWEKYEILNSNFLLLPHGLDHLAYSAEKHMLIRYLSTFDDNVILGQLNLNTQISSDIELNNSAPYDKLNLTCMGKSSCIMITYDASLGHFVFINLDQNQEAYFDLDAILDIETHASSNKPKFSEHYQAVFTEDKDHILLQDATEVYSLSLNKFSWEHLFEHHKLSNMEETCVVEYDEKLYFFGKLEHDEANEQQTEPKLKYYIYDYMNQILSSYYMPMEMELRQKISCVLSPNQEKIFLFGGSHILDENNEINNTYYSDLWVFDPNHQTVPISGAWKKIKDNYTYVNFLPPNEQGHRVFKGNIELPIFGKNQPRMFYDHLRDTLLLVGKIPPEQGFHLYQLQLNIDQERK